ncbi:MAG: 23S rRNA (pseudouridine(1915)-N(3))-methyltransferase RlmH [Proteobacteria bacterium]|nr:23S rRNA (pseudouridine(1915)-N(3))-methyltransferase RlmH [Pseudomonadota bacterium]
MGRMRIVAVGSRMPRWVQEPYNDYITRLSSALKVTLTEIEPGTRAAGRPPAKAIEAEGQRILTALRPGEFVVALDERGKEMTTRELATWLAGRLQDGSDLAFLIGGPDGFAPEVLQRCNFKWSLSRLTFPHALVRVVLAEQLYRAHGVLANHPYHRD